MTSTQDHIMTVLRGCEDELRKLATEGRLTSNALQTFAQLSAAIKDTVDRRSGNERRVTPRGTPDRRAASWEFEADSVAK